MKRLSILCRIICVSSVVADARAFSTIQTLSRNAAYGGGGTTKSTRCTHSQNTLLVKATNGSDDETTTWVKPSTSSIDKPRKEVAVLICPAQFCVPADYDGLYERLAPHVADAKNPDRTLVSCQVVPLPRTEWIKVAQQLPTMEFIRGELPVEKTLRWYFAAIEQGLTDIFARHGPNVNICVVGHSMGGWVARAYLGGQSYSSTAVQRLAQRQISSLITLGTPHTSSSTALVDQTRGLLAAIDASPSCTPQALVDAYSISDASSGDGGGSSANAFEITCVCSDAVTSKALTTNIEELVATASYLPLVGQIQGVQGDGIVPLDLAYLDPPARRVVVRTCSVTQQPIRHAHVVPTPWNLLNGYAPSIALDGMSIPSYVSEGVVHQWASYIR